MATSVISGRVDDAVRMRADAVIRAAGLSAGDIIRAVWERIAGTGELPAEVVAQRPEDAHDERKEALERFMQLRAELGSIESLVTLTDEQMREELSNRYV